MELREWCPWCEVDEVHTYFVARVENYLNDFGEYTVNEGDMLIVDGVTREICKIEVVDNTDPEQVWLMVYTHPREEVQPMTEAEWHGLYGNPELAE